MGNVAEHVEPLDPSEEAPVADSSAGTIPFTVRVGVTGHRSFTSEQTNRLRAQVEAQLEYVRKLFQPKHGTTLVLAAISALAEGADRLVAESVLGSHNGRLEVVLPLRVAAYLEDFEHDDPEETRKSKARFAELKEVASLIVDAPELAPDDESDPEQRRSQYEWAGRYVVDRCDVLLAVWDGQSSRGIGGTADVIRYALECSVPVIYLSTEGEKIAVDLGYDEAPRAFDGSGFSGRLIECDRNDERLPINQTRASLDELDRYNRQPRFPFFSRKSLAPGNLGQEILNDRTMHFAHVASMPDVSLVADWFRPYYVWADRRAVFYQKWYTLGTWVTFAAAAAAVLSAAIGTIFRKGDPWLFVVELVLLSSIGAVVYLWRRFHIHDQWINSRFLAERLRSAVFLKAAGVGVRQDTRLEGIRARDQSADWISRAYEFVWDSRRNLQTTNLGELRQLLVAGWIQPQIAYHRTKSNSHEYRDNVFFLISIGLFVLTGFIAVIHIVLHYFNTPMDLNNWFSLLAISLPACGSAIAGIAAHHQYHRHAVVYAGMVQRLELVRQRIEKARTDMALREAARDADDIMISEQRDWLGVMRFLDLDVG